ncbi:dTDP-4-dehydrorhamnose 3,5-epimerase [Gammaproteobacteria bacterium 45_16_T64]|nr:dTDP-4-dehydrorhamnose 3,5-epimerase [Gammaproteobacteria bacterium 45_16_T64]
MIDGVAIQELKILENPKGNIYHALKATEGAFAGFGEAYFSSVNCGMTKGWKSHQRMVLNLIVPVGNIRFVIFDDREGSITKNQFVDIILGSRNYRRLTVPPKVWVAFQGVGEGENLLLNLASIAHDPSEAKVCALADIDFPW